MQRQTKTRAKANLQAVLDEIEGLKRLRYGSPMSLEWGEKTLMAIKYAFDDRNKDRFFRRASHALSSFTGTEEDRQNNYISSLADSEKLLRSMMEEIDRFWDDDVIEQTTMPAKTPIGPDDKEVFVVHGRNKEVLKSVRAFLGKLGLRPIILLDQPGKGRTIIEKFEDHARVKYAVALLTPDDRALPNETGDEKELRARQNVIFEMGFFVGLLGRRHVAALLLGGIQIPSDYAGVEYIKLDESTWKRKLYQELHAAGFVVNAEQSVLNDCEGFIIYETAQGDAVEEPHKSVGEWSGIVHMVVQAYYRPADQEEFEATSILDQNNPTSSYVKSLPQEGNSKDVYGNEFPSAQYYQVILDGIDPKVGADLKNRCDNDESIHWRLVNEDKSVWETRTAMRSKTIRAQGGKLRVSFRIPEMEINIRDAV